MTTIAVPASLARLDTLLRAVRARRQAAGRALRVGDVLAGTYEILEHLGGGGMGQVYRAYDRRLCREVALKTPRLERAERGHMLAMFEREVRATARLCHPNIIALHQASVHQGLPFVVLELLHGEPLSERLRRRGRLPLRAAAEILDAVLAALGHAHMHGVLHRDLTPSNVFLTCDGRIKLLDFGVALDSSTQASSAARGAGTPGYMPPEHESRPGPRGDLWSAALLFLECVTGELPDARRPTAHLPSGLPPALHDLLARALHPDPQRRPPSAAQMREELVAGIRSAPAVSWRRRALWLLAAGVLSCSGAALAVQGLRAIAARAAPAPAQAAR